VLKGLRRAQTYSHRCCPPQHVPPRCRSVYGLVSGNTRPSRLPTLDAQWLKDLAYLTYRCGGSAGINLATGFTGFPFHPLTVPAKGLLNVQSVCPRIDCGSTTKSRAHHSVDWGSNDVGGTRAISPRFSASGRPAHGNKPFSERANKRAPLASVSPS
jgi:hypothetical protein